MTRACPRALDNPVRILGLSYAEWVVSAVAFSILVLMWRVVGLLLVWVPPVVLLKIRSGRNRGFFMHAVHDLDMVPIPGLAPSKREEFSTW